MRIYISGKISGTDDYLDRFDRVEKILSAKGHTVINPARVLDILPKDTTWQGYMATALAMLVQADAVYFLRGWRDSKGAVIERKVADSLGMLITFEGGKDG